MSHSDDLYKQYSEFKDLQRQIRKRTDPSINEVNKLKDLRDKIIQSANISQESARQCKLTGIVAFINLDYAKLSFVDNGEKENVAHGTIDMLKPFASKDECIYIYLKVVNFTAFLLVNREKFSDSQTILEDAESAYLNKKKENSKCIVFTCEELFKDILPIAINENLSNIYKVVTSNIQIQAYVYYKLGKNYKFQLYENMVLQRQLESADGSPVLWAKKATSLAAQFLYKGKFVEARHHLAAAYVVLQYCEEDMSKQGPNTMGKYFDLHINITELAKMWVKYAMQLFSFSKDNYPRKPSEKEFTVPQIETSVLDIMDQSKDPTILGNFPVCSKAEKPKIEEIQSTDQDFSKGDVQKNQEDVEKTILFHSLNLESVESQVTAELIGNTEQARQLFQFAYAWLVKLKSYHMISNLVTGHTDCMMYLNELYKYLAHYENNVKSKYNILKKRIDTLDSLVEVLRVENLTLHVQLTIDFLREISEVQLELVLLNINMLSMENISADSVEDDQNDIRLYKMVAISRIHSKLNMCNKTLTESTIFAEKK